MAILAFQKPENVIMMEATGSFAKFEFRPLEPGYGITIGNALRRILLSSLEGYAISSIRIEGVNHEFATIPGVLEDVTNIILNLKQVRFKPLVKDATEETISLVISGKDKFEAGDMNAKLSSFEVLNPELVICQIDPEYSLSIELTINKGRGYVPADEKHMQVDELQSIAIDSIYTPIRNVKYFTENYRVEQKTDYEKLILEITTDGSIHPQDALKESARILIEHFCLFSDEKIEVEEVVFEPSEEFDSDALHMRQLLKSTLDELDLSVRAKNCLQAANVLTLGELVGYQRNDLMKFRNFGKKSLTELDELLERLHLTFGMDVSKYKLDKD
ncbi:MULTISPECIES: DNA-directed RNA polymerase subunit alpha [unclassified Porphyromonas]|uniref:DNA-directed RNA polymerase subunit alpha n=1 Tax=unclassified Porphyromonas TaxID=2645799 RepID=UPI00052D0F28|nr:MULTISPECIES: DNA-directed RNA polymerase subunit alpha [unclassified Porphyromonas]KGN86721.1 DNA-directed RNA polymerase subunit alpha [Porphyromonas sp. COT-290 OH860]KGO01388.1 DNA-directed RNA polymerase subunit alpha [Porphyromonas sp. COT-290 OH3588]